MGKEFSYRQVARAITQNGNGAEQGEAVSATYIWALRTGVKTNPTMRHLQALARFFEVSPAYFFDEAMTDVPEGLRLLASSRDKTVHRVALSATGLSENSLGVVLDVIRRLRDLEGHRSIQGVEPASRSRSA
jgi:transcriptional regulator with XRE-family HTH domain